jgi:hypothetical protein
VALHPGSVLHLLNLHPQFVVPFEVRAFAKGHAVSQHSLSFSSLHSSTSPFPIPYLFLFEKRKIAFVTPIELEWIPAEFHVPIYNAQTRLFGTPPPELTYYGIGPDVHRAFMDKQGDETISFR